MSTELIVPEELETEMVSIHCSTFAVIDQGSRNHAMEFLKEIKGTANRIKEYWAPLKKQASDAHKAIVAREKKMLDPLEAKEKEVKAIVVAFDAEQERIRQAEQRRLQAEADAKAEAERQRLLKEAAKLKTPELREERMAAAEAVIAPTVVVAPQVAKGAGEATVTRWKARLVDKDALIRSAAEGDWMAKSFLQFDQVAANKQAVASKNNIPVRGVEFYADETLSVRA